MLLDILFITLGFAGLIWGADKFVAGASAIALNFGVAPLMIGLTIVAFGTSAPEFFSSAVAAIEGQPELAIGNAVGSNIFNIGVALGITTIIRPLTPPSSLLRQELPAMMLVTVVTGLLFADLYLGFVDSLALIALLLFLAYRLFRKKTTSPNPQCIEEDLEELDIPSIDTWRAAAYLFFGLVLLIAGAEALVSGASSVAVRMGVSSGIIGLTIVAMGTSLPELASTVAAVLRGHHDLAIGNIVGSNILNLLVVLPFPGLLSAGFIDPTMLTRDYATMLLMSCVMYGVCFWTVKSGKSIGRFCGIGFLTMYGGWFFTMYQQL
ncbi:MAG: calcium/sodium antiporter [Gammaproteobacteria bacterium]|nr:calcium/sodium antiporter [Gammaproteobacteria bacterium]MDP2140214.1 calcium/sodium antiporter [Gammaproteobacteria bacterium]MDP2348090.1 calcium/sodium antiporter [Gammaproteobacteria bacterium]